MLAATPVSPSHTTLFIIWGWVKRMPYQLFRPPPICFSSSLQAWTLLWTVSRVSYRCNWKCFVIAFSQTLMDAKLNEVWVLVIRVSLCEIYHQMLKRLQETIKVPTPSTPPWSDHYYSLKQNILNTSSLSSNWNVLFTVHVSNTLKKYIFKCYQKQSSANKSEMYTVQINANNHLGQSIHLPRQNSNLLGQHTFTTIVIFVVIQQWCSSWTGYWWIFSLSYTCNIKMKTTMPFFDVCIDRHQHFLN